MSSWKNAHKAHQKPHRERHQPESRKHLGLLEKKKDYKLRANDFNAKKAELQFLQKRALDRNPDEFYYHMINSKVDDGLHRDKAKDLELTPEQVQLMQSQDYKYVATKRTMEANKVQKLQANLHQLSEEAPNKHVFFVDSQLEKNKFNLVKKLGTSKSMLKRRYNRIRTQDLEKINLVGSSSNPTEVIKNIVKEKRQSYKLLEKRQARMEKLLRLQRKMELKAALQDKKKEVKRRIEPPNKEAAPIYEFKQERKR